MVSTAYTLLLTVVEHRFYMCKGNVGRVHTHTLSSELFPSRHAHRKRPIRRGGPSTAYRHVPPPVEIGHENGTKVSVARGGVKGTYIQGLALGEKTTANLPYPGIRDLCPSETALQARQW
jgi:hypothetical protein